METFELNVPDFESDKNEINTTMDNIKENFDKKIEHFLLKKEELKKIDIEKLNLKQLESLNYEIDNLYNIIYDDIDLVRDFIYKKYKIYSQMTSKLSKDKSEWKKIINNKRLTIQKQLIKEIDQKLNLDPQAEINNESIKEILQKTEHVKFIKESFLKEMIDWNACKIITNIDKATFTDLVNNDFIQINSSKVWEYLKKEYTNGVKNPEIKGLKIVEMNNNEK